MGRSTANLQALHQGGVSCNPVYGLQYTLDVTTGDAHDDEEEKPLLPLPRRQLAAGRRGAAVLAVWAALAVVYLYTYARSLAGGAHSRDLKWMAPHTGMIGGYLAAAVLSWTVAQWATVPLAARWRRLAWGLRGGLAASLMFFLAYDHGACLCLVGAGCCGWAPAAGRSCAGWACCDTLLRGCPWWPIDLQ